MLERGLLQDNLCLPNYHLHIALHCRELQPSCGVLSMPLRMAKRLAGRHALVVGAVDVEHFGACSMGCNVNLAPCCRARCHGRARTTAHCIAWGQWHAAVGGWKYGAHPDCLYVATCCRACCRARARTMAQHAAWGRWRARRRSCSSTRRRSTGTWRGSGATPPPRAPPGLARFVQVSLLQTRFGSC